MSGIKGTEVTECCLLIPDSALGLKPEHLQSDHLADHHPTEVVVAKIAVDSCQNKLVCINYRLMGNN